MVLLHGTVTSVIDIEVGQQSPIEDLYRTLGNEVLFERSPGGIALMPLPELLRACLHGFERTLAGRPARLQTHDRDPVEQPHRV